ncbi:hypothetical protein A2J04_10105 [Rhodococcus sp. EPR-279]|nr:hypothetical protein A2J02_08940 [Rhodococcus sp. EPR-147]KZF01846.1 hypothetical protein A2J04_10105 [Rhodococcus sp. EPR-279]
MRSFLVAPADSSFFIRMITTGHLMQRTFLRQHFFLGFIPETSAAFILPMSTKTNGWRRSQT